MHLEVEHNFITEIKLNEKSLRYDTLCKTNCDVKFIVLAMFVTTS